MSLIRLRWRGQRNTGVSSRVAVFGSFNLCRTRDWSAANAFTAAGLAECAGFRHRRERVWRREPLAAVALCFPSKVVAASMVKERAGRGGDNTRYHGNRIVAMHLQAGARVKGGLVQSRESRLKRSARPTLVRQFSLLATDLGQRGSMRPSWSDANGRWMFL
jgi:hypothetical protein